MQTPGEPGVQIAGLPVLGEPAGLMTPLAAVAFVKGLNADGKVMYWRLQTADLSDIEAIGMHEAASAMYKQRLPR